MIEPTDAEYRAFTDDQKVIYHTRIGELCGTGLITETADAIARKEAREFEEMKEEIAEQTELI